MSDDIYNASRHLRQSLFELMRKTGTRDHDTRTECWELIQRIESLLNTELKPRS